MKHLFIKAGGAGGRHVHLILRILPVVFLCYAVYLLLGMWLPFLFQPGVSKEFQRGFDKSGFYGTGSVDRAALIDDNVAALEIRIRMIEEAQKRLIFTNFDIRDCESGRDVAAALLAAAERGVQVQVLTDGMNGLVSMASSPVFYALGAHPNIEIRFYNTPNPLMPWTFNGRLHDKYILSDDRAGCWQADETSFDKFYGTMSRTRKRVMTWIFCSIILPQGRLTAVRAYSIRWSSTFRWFGLTATAKPGWSPHHFSIERAYFWRQKPSICGTAHGGRLIRSF